jgi:hypothetical protein
VSVWEDVVTTGLIGTDRRAVPDDLPQGWAVELDQILDPAHAVLSLAARHRAANRAGGRLPSCPPGPAAPPNRKPVASPAAHEILARLLSPPQADLLNLWLRTAVQYGQHTSPTYWTPLAMLAVRTTELDRTALAEALGDRGVWFVEQNPEWARLAKGLRAHPKEQNSAERSDSGVEVSEDAVRADPELILRVPHPSGPQSEWPDEVTRAVLAIIASDQLQQRAVRYATAVGARLPLHHYELLRSAVQHITAREQALTPAGLRSVRAALLALERTVWLRIEMQRAFSNEPMMVQRLEIPPW